MQHRKRKDPFEPFPYVSSESPLKKKSNHKTQHRMQEKNREPLSLAHNFDGLSRVKSVPTLPKNYRSVSSEYMTKTNAISNSSSVASLLSPEQHQPQKVTVPQQQQPQVPQTKIVEDKKAYFIRGSPSITQLGMHSQKPRGRANFSNEFNGGGPNHFISREVTGQIH